jgi:hypothetical protein
VAAEVASATPQSPPPRHGRGPQGPRPFAFVAAPQDPSGELAELRERAVRFLGPMASIHD